MKLKINEKKIIIDGILTLELLKEMPKHHIFAQGYFVDRAGVINLANTNNIVKWVAVRGEIWDWAIYCDNPFYPQDNFKQVADYGDKLYNKEYIKKLVNCDNEAFKMYRH